MKSALAFLALLVSVPAHAWLGRGHEQIADIAWTQLKPDVRKEVYDILMAGDVSFRPAGTAEADVRAAFRKASTWADWIKSNKTGQYEPEIEAWNKAFQPGYDPADKSGEAHRCKRWHYFDVPIKAGEHTPGVEGSNALVCLTVARYESGILARQPVKDRRSQCWWLAWQLHVVGDLHQPLHCVSCYEGHPDGDAGGNLFKLGIGYPDNEAKKMNLHFFWDRGIEYAIEADEDQDQSFEAVSSRWSKSNEPSKEQAEEFSIAKWIGEGAKLAEEVTYNGINPDDVPSKEYRAKMLPLCRKQAVLAGYRLAHEVNSALGAN